MNTCAGERDVAVRDTETLEDGDERRMDIAGLGTPNVVAVDERERVVLALEEHPAVEAWIVLGDSDRLTVDVVTAVAPLVPGVVVALGGRRPLTVRPAIGTLLTDVLRRVGGTVFEAGAFRAREVGVPVAPRRERALCLVAHPLLALQPFRRPDAALGVGERLHVPLATRVGRVVSGGSVVLLGSGVLFGVCVVVRFGLSTVGERHPAEHAAVFDDEVAGVDGRLQSTRTVVDAVDELLGGRRHLTERRRFASVDDARPGPYVAPVSLGRRHGQHLPSSSAGQTCPGVRI